MQQIDWEVVMNLKAAQGAYSEFNAVVTKLYNKMFPYKKTNKPYFDNIDEQWSKYKIYPNKLYHLVRVTERQYYQDQLTKHKSNL